MTLAGKTIQVDIEVIEAPLDYNILLGRSYMYPMSIFTSIVFRNMCFPHEGKIITIDQLAYYKSALVTSPKSIISSMFDKNSITPLSSASLRFYKIFLTIGCFP